MFSFLLLCFGFIEVFPAVQSFILVAFLLFMWNKMALRVVLASTLPSPQMQIPRKHDQVVSLFYHTSVKVGEDHNLSTPPDSHPGKCFTHNMSRRTPVWDYGIKVQGLAQAKPIITSQPIPTKTLASLVQSAGSLSSSRSTPVHIFSTSGFFSALAPYLALLVVKQSIFILTFKVCVQRLDISLAVAGALPLRTRSCFFFLYRFKGAA